MCCEMYLNVNRNIADKDAKMLECILFVCLCIDSFDSISLWIVCFHQMEKAQARKLKKKFEGETWMKIKWCFYLSNLRRKKKLNKI